MAYYNGKETGIYINVNALTSEINLFPSQIAEGFAENSDLGGVYSTISTASFVLSEKDTYYVKWDNEEFICVGKPSMTEPPLVYIGNGSIFGLDAEDDEPFCIYYNSDTQRITFVAIDDTHEIHRVRVYQKLSVVKVRPLSADRNDIYDAPEGEAYSPVTVDVSSDADILFDEVDDRLDAINGEVVGEDALEVTFIGADGTVLCTMPAYEGYDCEDPVAVGEIETPTKESVGIYKYTFTGWSDTSTGEASPSVLKGIRAPKTVYAVFTREYNYIAQGQCEDSSGNTTQVFWGLHPNGLLRFWGTGEIVSPSRVTGHHQYDDQVTEVIIEEGVTEIGGNAFYNFGNLQSVLLPNTLTTIDQFAFYGCRKLTSITIPASVTRLNYNVFGSAESNKAGLKTAIFEDPTGWKYLNSVTNEEVSVSADLADSTTAAYMLTNTYDVLWYKD